MCEKPDEMTCNLPEGVKDASFTAVAIFLSHFYKGIRTIIINLED